MRTVFKRLPPIKLKYVLEVMWLHMIGHPSVCTLGIPMDTDYGGLLAVAVYGNPVKSVNCVWHSGLIS